MSDKPASVLLVGSVPLESAEAVFRTCSQELGEYLWCLPDGEVGDRTIWVVFQAYRVFHEHPDLVTLQRPQRGPEPWIPGDLTDVWRFAMKDGVEDVQFTDLKYASAQKYLSHFGAATECGFGRREPDTLPELFRIHRETAALLRP